MLVYTTLWAKRQKRKHAINLINFSLSKMLPKPLPIGYSISYSVPLKGSLQASPIKWILPFLEGEATRTSMR